VKGGGEPVEDVQGGIVSAAFDPGDVGRVQIGVVCKGLDGEPPLLTEGPNRRSERRVGWSRWPGHGRDPAIFAAR
jgi:hypothetical protein